MAFFMIYYTHSTYKIRARKTFVKNNNEHSIDNLGLLEITWEIFYRIKNLKIYFFLGLRIFYNKKSFSCEENY